jgi:alanine racemase
MTWADIDLQAIAGNITLLRQAAVDAQFLAVVKADGYGHGMLPVARTARDCGVDALGVALPSEAMRLRAAGDRGPLLCWLYSPEEDLTECVGNDVQISAASPQMLQQIAAAATRADTRAEVHLKIDTGLGRNGAAAGDWERLLRDARALQSAGRIEVVGIWSHLACADEPDHPATGQQLHNFAAALDTAREIGITPRLRHVAATAGVLAWPDAHYDLVRCGIGIYGLTPGPAIGTSLGLGLSPAMSLRARVALVKSVPAGHGVSYGWRYSTSTSTRLALIPAGYGDGIPRAGSGRVPVRIGEQQFVVRGTVAMDQVVLDVGDIPVRAGDVVELFGSGRDGGPTADDWAEACDTINYEIVTRISPRVLRLHHTGAA